MGYNPSLNSLGRGNNGLTVEIRQGGKSMLLLRGRENRFHRSMYHEAIKKAN